MTTPPCWGHCESTMTRAPIELLHERHIGIQAPPSVPLTLARGTTWCLVMS